MFEWLFCILFIFMFQFSQFSGAVQRRCYTPDQYLGVCTELSKCEPLKKLRLKLPASHEDKVFLSLSLCERLSKDPLVCCSMESLYPQSVLQKSRLPAMVSSNSLPDLSECVSAFEERIIGGVETRIDEFPFSALLFYTTKSSNTTGLQNFCGGSLISHKFVVTAAHCVSQKLLDLRDWELKAVRLGEHNLLTTLDCGEGLTEDYICALPVIDVEIEQQIIHENFNENRHNDIALLKLKHNVKFTKFVKPICLPPINSMLSTDKINFYVAGFGRTESGENSDIKLKTSVSGISNEECQTMLKTHTKSIIVNTQLCTLSIDGKDSCSGDSGSGLIYMNTLSTHAHWLLMGIVSFGSIPCGSDEIPSVYTRVSEFVPWILNKL